MAAGVVRVGISGWRYAPWRGVFYPAGLRQRAELEFASRQLASIEINGSFYSLQPPAAWQSWHDETPDDFVFAVKGPRFVTHMKKLRDVRAPVANFFASGVLALRAKLGADPLAIATESWLRTGTSGVVPVVVAARYADGA